MLQDRPLTLEIEIRMVREVDDRISVGRRAILDAQLVTRQAIINKRFDVPGITFLAILADIRQVQNVVFFSCTPNALIEPFEATVKMVRAVVSRKLILDSVQSKSTVSDTIRVAPNHSAEV